MYMNREEFVEWCNDHGLMNWPHAIQRFIGRHMNNQERFTFTCFIMGNGFTDWDGFFHLMELHDVYDAQAWRQLRWLKDNFERKRYSYWDMTLGRSNR